MPPAPSSSRRARSYAVGQVIAGKYELEQLLGEGGMGAVWRARNTALDLQVAIKLIRADLNRKALGARLLEEARAAASLGHPAIVRVFDVGETEQGDPLIVMELLEGESLASLLSSTGRLGSTRAVQLLLPIAEALAAAHAKRIVHRDLKPDNIFVARTEGQVQPKLVDFGIAKLEKRAGGSLLTQVGAVLGSPEYMSPEQARGRHDIDLRTDVWSFSVVLYEALTGTPPFQAANYNALLRMIVEHEAPTVKALAAGNAELSAIVERGMFKDPARRWASMSDFGRALANWLIGQGLNEDACGVSLETKWLGRSTEEASRPLGLRYLSPSDVATGLEMHAHDIPANAMSTMPAPANETEEQTSKPPMHSGPSRGRAAVIALAALAAAAVAAWRPPNFSRNEAMANSAALRSSPDVATPSVPRDSAASTSDQPGPPSAPASSDWVRAPASSPANAASTGAIRDGRKPRKATGRQKSDLIAPY